MIDLVGNTRLILDFPIFLRYSLTFPFTNFWELVQFTIGHILVNVESAKSVSNLVYNQPNMCIYYRGRSSTLKGWSITPLTLIDEWLY